MSNIIVTNVNGHDVDAGQVKAWARFNGNGTVALQDSLNISSLTDNGVGDYAVGFSSNMANSNYAESALSGNTVSHTSSSTSDFRVINVATSSGAAYDGLVIALLVHGDLA
jgi:hypothetical protein